MDNPQMIRNLSGRQASKTFLTFTPDLIPFETSQADRHRKRRLIAEQFVIDSKPLRPTGIENSISQV